MKIKQRLNILTAFVSGNILMLAGGYALFIDKKSTGGLLAAVCHTIALAMLAVLLLLVRAHAAAKPKVKEVAFEHPTYGPPKRRHTRTAVGARDCVRPRIK